MKNFQPGPLQKIRDVGVGECVTIGDFVNLYECRIGANTSIGNFVEIGKGVVVGQRCQIRTFAYLCPGVNIEDDVFIGEGTTFINDRFARATNADGTMVTESDWTLRFTTVRQGASIEAKAIIMCDVTIGVGARVKAGSVVTKDVPDGATVAGNPARILA
ncbi:MAG: N-acetyltransferase [Candidatus Obscuribacterales bacterium]|nr:N-acetyltransferase [Candidatus Obscuribacterales bacterium]